MSETVTHEPGADRSGSHDQQQARRRVRPSRSLVPGGSAVLLGLLVLTACSSGSAASGQPTGKLAQVSAGSTATTATTATTHVPPVHATGSFCGDFRSLTLKAAEVARSLSTFTPQQVKAAVTADRRLQQTAAAEAPAQIRNQIVLASMGPQFDALQAAGYDLRKVGASGMELTPAQKQALLQVQSYVIAKCGFDPKRLIVGNK